VGVTLWTKAADKTLLANTNQEAARLLEVSEAACRARRRRLAYADYHQDRDDAGQLRKLVNQSAWMDRVLGAIHESAVTLPALRVPTVRGSESEEYMLMFSDWQYGEKVTLEQTGGLAEYNADVAAKRLGEMVALVLEEQKRKPLKRLNVAGIGDFLEGHNIYASQAYHVDVDVVHQAVYGGKLFADALRELSQHFEVVNVVPVIGNHGRFDKTSKVMSNMDYMLMKYAEALLATQPNIRMTVPETWYALIERFGVRYLLAHGDDMVLSRDGADKYQRRWRNLVGEFSYLLTGHHHEFSVFTGAGWTAIVNGSLVGPSEYSLKTMSLGGNGMQALLTVGSDGVRDIKPLKFSCRAGKTKTYTE
jgi:predicted phosphodiesterase